MEEARILVVDDDEDILVAAKLLLRRHFGHVDTTSKPIQIPKLLEKHDYNAILLDMNFAVGEASGKEGLHWLGQIKELDPNVAVVLITAYSDIETAVDAMKQGAYDFVSKPWQNERLVATVTAAVSLQKSRAETELLKGQTKELAASVNATSQDLVGSSAPMRKVVEMIGRAAPTDANVLILGENGTGKEVVAREIHNQSGRRDEIWKSVV